MVRDLAHAKRPRTLWEMAKDRILQAVQRVVPDVAETQIRAADHTISPD